MNNPLVIGCSQVFIIELKIGGIYMIIKALTEIKLRDRKEISNFVLFSLGKFVSVFGTSIYTFAIGLYVLKITGSGLSFAATLVFGLIAVIIFNPIAGVMADRFDKKKIVVAMDLLNGFLFITLYFISLMYNLNLIIIYLSTFLTTVFTTIFGISIETAKPNIVSDEKLMNINSISKIIDSISSIIGPIIGGLIFAFIDIQSFILVNGLSFVFSAVTEMLIDFKYNYKVKSKEEIKTGFIKDVKEGFKYIIDRKDIIGIFSIFITLNFFISFSVTVPLPFIINNVLKLSSREFGIIQSSFPSGMIIGAIFVKKVIEKVSYNKLLVFMSLLLSTSMILLGVPLLLMNLRLNSIIYLLYYSIIIIIFGIAISLIDIPIIYILQKIIPDEFRGRVLSIGMSIGKIISPVALIISGFLLNKISSYILPITGGSLLLVVNIIILKGIRIADLDINSKFNQNHK